MSDFPTAQRLALESWAHQAIEAGWLTHAAASSLQDVNTAAPSQLFDTVNRPLVAGLFGGTGVGKSTLMNRLAGESIARASAERPTSRDITVYVHRSVSVDSLPSKFPMENMRTALHNNDQYRQVLFIDMPDFDSVESANRELVNLWLPHLDVVLYVVSPERYRDDQGWRLLLRHAREHAWLFIMNHWDRGDPVQLEDFRKQLSGAGVEDPMIFRSDSSQMQIDSMPSSVELAAEKQSHAHPFKQTVGSHVDDFSSFQATLRQLADQSIIESLNEYGILARLKMLKVSSDRLLESVGDDEKINTLQLAWQVHWHTAAANLHDSIENRAQQIAQQYARQCARREGTWLSRMRGKPLAAPVKVTGPLVDESLLNHLDNTLVDFLNQQSHASMLSLKALKLAVADPYARARREFEATVDAELHRSLALPGSKSQRNLHKHLGWLSFILPLTAMGWINRRVVKGFVAGGSNPAAYLASSFTVNGSLLLTTWLIPAFLRRMVKPSLSTAVKRGVEQGMQTALAQTAAAVSEGLKRLGEQAGVLRQQYDDLWQFMAPMSAVELPDQLRRMLVREIKKAPQRTLDVRANTHDPALDEPVS